MGDMELDKGVISNMLAGFRVLFKGLVAPVEEIEDSKESPTLKEYVKNNPEAAALLEETETEKKYKKIYSEELKGKNKKKEGKASVVNQVNVQQPAVHENSNTQEIVKGDEEQQL